MTILQSKQYSGLREVITLLLTGHSNIILEKEKSAQCNKLCLLSSLGYMKQQQHHLRSRGNAV